MPETHNEVFRIVMLHIKLIVVEGEPSSQVVLDLRNGDRRSSSPNRRRERALQVVFSGLNLDGARHDHKRTERPRLLRGAQHRPLSLNVGLRRRWVEDGIHRPLLPRRGRRRWGRWRGGLRRRGRTACGGRRRRPRCRGRAPRGGRPGRHCVRRRPATTAAREPMPDTAKPCGGGPRGHRVRRRPATTATREPLQNPTLTSGRRRSRSAALCPRHTSMQRKWAGSHLVPLRAAVVATLWECAVCLGVAVAEATEAAPLKLRRHPPRGRRPRRRSPLGERSGERLLWTRKKPSPSGASSSRGGWDVDEA